MKNGMKEFIIGASMIIVTLLFFVGGAIVILRFPTPACVERADEYYVNDWGSVYYLGSDEKAAIEKSGGRPVGIERGHCIKWDR